jgi:hypothetical protein
MTNLRALGRALGLLTGKKGAARHARISALVTPKTRTGALGRDRPQEALTASEADDLPASASLKLRPVSAAFGLLCLAIIVGAIIAMAVAADVVVGHLVMSARP